MSSKYLDTVNAVREFGIGIIPRVFKTETIEEIRSIILENLYLMKNTRQTPSSRHLAGFHRYPALEPLHNIITSSTQVYDVLKDLCSKEVRTIGLSDITINRSQQWHKDLLRGKYQHYLDGENICAESNGKAFKVLVYLQDSSSLQFVEGSHRHDISLSSDVAAVPENESNIHRVKVCAGDVVVMDICTTHRGATEEQCSLPGLAESPRILLSTVFGQVNCAFTDKMEIGNAVRQIDWAKEE